MAKLPSTDLSPILNAIARGEQRWTGDPAYSALFFFIHATAVESARILQGGQASVAQLNEGARQEADKWANINMTPASFDAVADAMHEEGENRIKNYEDAIDAQRVPPTRGGASSHTVHETSTEPEYTALPLGSWYRKPGDPPDSHRVKQ